MFLRTETGVVDLCWRALDRGDLADHSLEDSNGCDNEVSGAISRMLCEMVELFLVTLLGILEFCPEIPDLRGGFATHESVIANLAAGEWEPIGF